MSAGISENDLPSVKFENELKKNTNYYEFEDYRKGITSEESIDIWITNFKQKAEQYLTVSYNNSSFNKEKRCNDFNSFITNTISKLFLLSYGVANAHQRAQDIKQWRKNYFIANHKFMCNEEKQYESDDIKTLDNFCEDSAFIKENRNNIKRKVDCDNINNNMSSRKTQLRRIHNMNARGGGTLEINNHCNTGNLEILYSSINCNSIIENESRSDSVHNTADTLQMRHGSSYPNERSPHDESSPTTGESGKNNTIALASLPVLGILIISFLFYRYTPFGSKFHEYFRNKQDISINGNDEVTEEMLSGTSQYNDIYSENMQYNLSYQTFQN
ncbi:PIR Superfamily Protein [Plasmodium ovale wallikeri]|uniref:PIR Superfamily Protein n=1 Tax=Plasmodium ovale wallikeri TaxID=864142 RepID=A0A1A9ANY7_PLAOA|nr:PIR Superfamily Protein [Plasmodium ovale wallikeri]SBT58052.1 PIR Superfamily Protein [Plasmodium ovale wallikeri]